MENTSSVLTSTLSEVGLGSAKSSKPDATEKDQFLNLFVAQLKNQNPLDPKDGSEFLGQLAQFSMVEGISNLSSSFGELAGNLTANQALQASSLVGKNVDVKSGSMIFDGGHSVNGVIKVPQSVSDLSLKIVDENGLVVKTYELGAQPEGPFNFTWNGLDESGQPLSPGIYSLEALSTIDGAETQLDTYISANVDSVTINKEDKGITLNVFGFGPISMDEIETFS